MKAPPPKPHGRCWFRPEFPSFFPRQFAFDPLPHRSTRNLRQRKVVSLTDSSTPTPAHDDRPPVEPHPEFEPDARQQIQGASPAADRAFDVCDMCLTIHAVGQNVHFWSLPIIPALCKLRVVPVATVPTRGRITPYPRMAPAHFPEAATKSGPEIGSPTAQAIVATALF